ncbi:hypothetical protein ZYGR_0K00460 [Zygosaccharomyces rouxii]|uniref:Swi6 N-terminal domain-containing protein n=1 Tax=Zygosaccharomyces rouxii TaxID=4956 RepID=A0A1Q2ZYK4_ZYGRO|nr:hypothetical protein ZYGR_0K00460 [Zygosaccharomyces rouxii]
MSVVEVTKLIGEEGHQVPLTLKRSNETGYFLLKPFLPLLQQLLSDEGEATVDDIGNTEVAVQQEDRILSKYGILVDTDDSNEKWITGEKAFELMQLLNLLYLFKEDFEKQSNGGENHQQQQQQQPQESSHNQEQVGSGAAVNDRDLEGMKDDSGDGGASSHSSSRSGKDEGVSGNNGHKRPNKELGINVEAQRELGSPLKRLRLDRNSPPDETMASFATTTDVKPTEVSNVRSIVTYNHDMNPSLVDVPLSIKRSQSPPIVPDNNQRMKLEAFLQRLLFPEVQDLSSAAHDTHHHMSFETLLHEVDMTFPDVSLNLNVPVDEHGNTPLHWLASIANLDVVKQLVKNGSNRFLGDNIGESALVKAVKSVNNYDSGTFEELLDYLYPCLILEDSMNRTILHHIVITSGMTGCSSAAKYYLDILMGWIVKKQSRSIEGSGSDPILDTLDLKWVISHMLNAPDSNGDTCLNIASRLGNVALVDSLLDYGADPYVANKSGLRPVDFGAGTSKLLSNGISTAGLNHLADPASTAIGDAKVPDTMSLIEEMQSLLETVSKDYDSEVKDHQERLDKLHKDLNSHREMLAACRDRLAHAKQLQDEHALLKEQLANIKREIQEEEENFRLESKQLGISLDDDSGADWDSSEFDADEPFRVDFIYDILESKLVNEYGGNIDKLLATESVDKILKHVRSTCSQNGEDKLETMLPPSFLLKARINAYKRNGDRLNSTIDVIKQKQSDLESKFRRVLCLCLKVDEDKVDGMLDGLLQAISSEDPQDVDTEEMQDFLKKHAV